MKKKAYAGNGRPFVCVLYAPEDQEGADSVIDALHEKGYDTWPSVRFDKRRIKKAALVLFVLSKAALESDTMNRAIDHTVQTDRPMLAVYLESAELTPAQKLLLNTQQGIMRYDCETDAGFQEKLFGSALLQDLGVTNAQKRAAAVTTWSIAGGVLAAAALALILALGLNATVPDDSLIAELGYTGRISDITGVYLYGDVALTEQSGLSIRGYVIDFEAQTRTDELYYSGSNESAPFGSVGDISDFAQLKNLSELSLAGNCVSDISALFELKNLEYLDLTGNPVASLSGIGELTQLKTLCIGGTQITDLSPLDECEALETVCVDQDQYRAFSAEDAQRAYELILVGPKEELANLSMHIFGGPEEEGVDYAVFMQTRSVNIYDDYTFEFWKNDEQIQITGIEHFSSLDNGIMDKTHINLNQNAFGTYDPTAEYRLVVHYGDYSATYRVWHKYVADDDHNVGGGELISTSGF